jgi:hypothetical protein
VVGPAPPVAARRSRSASNFQQQLPVLQQPATSQLSGVLPGRQLSVESFSALRLRDPTVNVAMASP